MSPIVMRTAAVISLLLIPLQNSLLAQDPVRSSPDIESKTRSGSYTPNFPKLLTGQESDDLKSRAQTLQKTVTKLRGLDFLKEVKVGIYTKAQLREFMTTELAKELPQPKAEREQKVMYKLGLIPRDLDLVKAYSDLYSESVAGFYHPRTKELYLIKKDPKDTPDKERKQMELMEKMMGVSMDDVYLVHELVHAAQDQNYDLQSLELDDSGNDDLSFAQKCFIEGEATVVMWQYLFKDRFDAAKTNLKKVMADQPLSKSLSKLPTIMKQSLVAPYSSGYDFVLQLKEHKEDSWANVAKLYDDLPTSTEQILHPEKYFDTRDNPTQITLPMLRNVLGDDWKLLSRNVCGEFTIKILMMDLKVPRFRQVSEGWDGDTYAVYENKKNGKLMLLWYTVWDDESEAGEFKEGYHSLISKKYDGVKEQDGSRDNLRLYQTGEDQIVIEQKKNQVLIIEGAPPAMADSLRERLWTHSRQKELKKVQRSSLKRNKSF